MSNPKFCYLRVWFKSWKSKPFLMILLSNSLAAPQLQLYFSVSKEILFMKALPSTMPDARRKMKYSDEIWLLPSHVILQQNAKNRASKKCRKRASREWKKYLHYWYMMPIKPTAHIMRMELMSHRSLCQGHEHNVCSNQFHDCFFSLPRSPADSLWKNQTLHSCWLIPFFSCCAALNFYKPLYQANI